MRRHFLIPALSLVLSLAAVGSASAHAHLENATPSNGAVLNAAPDRITVELSEAIEPAFSHLTLKSAAGRDISLGSATVDTGNKLTAAPSAPLPPDHYTVDWSVLSVDGHRTSGTLAFEVRP